MKTIFRSKGHINIKRTLEFVTPIFVTMPTVTIPIASRDISVFSILFICLLVVLVINLVKKKEIKITTPSKYYLIWLVLALFGTFCGILYFGETYSLWKNRAISYIPKILLFFIFAICWGNVTDERDTEIILKGILYGIIANIVFAVLDGAIYYITRRSINNIIFSGYIERHKSSVAYGMLSLIDSGGGIRVSGFNTDSSNIGLLAPIVIFFGLYRKKYVLVLMGVLAVFFSQSTTALFCILVIVLFDIGIILNRKIRLTIPRVLIISLAVFCGLYFLFVNNNILNRFSGTIESFFSRIENTYINLNYLLSKEPRFAHILKLAPAIINAGPLILFGTGFGTMSYAYTMGSNQLIDLPFYMGKAYDIDMTYLDYLFDVGIIGLVLYLFIIFKILRYFRPIIKSRNGGENDTLIYCSIFALIVTHFTYHYVFSADQVLLIIVALNYITIRKKKLIIGSDEIRQLFR